MESEQLRSSRTKYLLRPKIRSRTRKCKNQQKMRSKRNNLRIKPLPCKRAKIDHKFTGPDEYSADTTSTQSENSLQSPPATDESVKCVICLDTQNSKEIQPILCGHSFHRMCLETWLQRENRCPICRSPVDPISAHYLLKFRFFVENMSQWAMRIIVR